jgi:hypothetical protein
MLLNHLRFKPASFIPVRNSEGEIIPDCFQLSEAGFAARYLSNIHGGNVPSVGSIDEKYQYLTSGTSPNGLISNEIQTRKSTHRCIRDNLMPLRGGHREEDILEICSTYNPSILWEFDTELPLSVEDCGESSTMLVENTPSTDDTNHRILDFEDCYLRTYHDVRPYKRSRKGKLPE